MRRLYGHAMEARTIEFFRLTRRWRNAQANHKRVSKTISGTSAQSWQINKSAVVRFNFKTHNIAG